MYREELYYGALNAIQYSMVQYLLLIRWYSKFWEIEYVRHVDVSPWDWAYKQLRFTVMEDYKNSIFAHKKISMIGMN